MSIREFDVSGLMATKFRMATYYLGTHDSRELLRSSVLSTLELAHQSGIANEETFSSLLSKHPCLSPEQISIAAEMCNAASAGYRAWREESELEKAKIKKFRQSQVIANPQTISNPETGKTKPNTTIPHLHGGSGYTGRLRVGSAAPHGSESFQSVDEPRMGLTAWVKAMTGGGSGAGHSLAELSSSKQPKVYAGVIQVDVLNAMRRDGLLNVMDKATNPGNFLRAMLAYYGHSMIVPLNNVGNIDSSNINSPENIRSMCQLDTIFNYMKRIDNHAILSPAREARFLLLCDRVLEKVKIKEPRSRDKSTEEKYTEQSRSLRMARIEIRDFLREASDKAGISQEVLWRRIDSDKRAHIDNHRYVPL